MLLRRRDPAPGDIPLDFDLRYRAAEHIGYADQAVCERRVNHQ